MRSDPIAETLFLFLVGSLFLWGAVEITCNHARNASGAAYNASVLGAYPRSKK